MAKNILDMMQTTDYIISSGRTKIKKKLYILLLQGIMAGFYIAFGAIGYFKITSLAAGSGVGTFLAAAIFPTGIIAIIILGAELFTSDCMMMMGVYDRKYSIWHTLRVLFIVWTANLIGMVLVSGLTSLSGIFSEAMTLQITHMALIKTSLPVEQMIFSAVLCNMIVCTGVWMAYSVKETIAKIAMLWFMITVFALSGTEHIVANMYFLFTAFFLGADITMGGIFYNLLFVTIGNFIGGAFIVTGIHKLIVGNSRSKA